MTKLSTDLDGAAAAVAGGDSKAFLQIVRATEDRLVRLSARLLGSLSEAEDVVQEAYLRAYRSLRAGKFDRRSQVTTWLHRIVVNATLDAKRARSRSRTSPSASLPEASTDGSASTEARLALRELESWLGALPEEQQVVLVLKVLEDMSSAEVAAIVGCSEGAVEQRLVRARAALRKMEGEP